MKNRKFINWMVLALLALGSMAHAGGSYTADTFLQKTFIVRGELQRYIPFQFTVPWGIETYEYKHGWPNFGVAGEWELKEPGAAVMRGIYRFVNTQSGSARFVLTGAISTWEMMGTWQAMETEPDDVGLLGKNKWTPGNYFRLTADDLQASYYLVFPQVGSEISLEEILNGQEFIFMHGRLKAAIVSDDRGFLTTVIRHEKQFRDVIVQDQDIVVLVYGDEYVQP